MPNIPIDWGRFASRWGYKDEVDMFTDLYLTQKLSYSQLADRFDVSMGSIVVKMKSLGIKARPKGGAQNPGYSRKRMWFLDQRAVYGMSLKKFVLYARVSQSVVYSYRHRMARGFDAFLHNQPGVGSTTLRNLLKNASRAVSRDEPGVPEVLPGEREGGGFPNS